MNKTAKLLPLDIYKGIVGRNTGLYRLGVENGIRLAINYLVHCGRSCDSEYVKDLLGDAIEDLLDVIKYDFDEEVISAIFLSNADKDFSYSDDGLRDYFMP